VWPNRPEPNPFTEALNKTRKYVVSNTLSEPLPWVNSTLLSGDGVEAVARLKQQLPQDESLRVLGSGDLLHSLIPAGLIDEYTLLITPPVLGRGLRLFPEDAYAPLELVESITTTTGVVIATYRPA
jgi:dihydrofolate reductase